MKATIRGKVGKVISMNADSVTQIQIDGYEKYKLALIKAVQPVILNRPDEEQKAVGEVLRNMLFDLDGPRHTSSKFSQTERLIGELFFDFTEITKSYLSLRDIEIYVRRFPYRDTDVSRSRYLRYHVENYLNEVYILQERLTKHLTIIERRYRKSQRIQEIKAKLDPLYKLVSLSLDGIISIRGSHVHRVRFSDEDTERLEIFELIDNADEPFLSGFHNMEYRKIRNKWLGLIKSNNNGIKKLLNIYCNNLYFAIFDERGNLILPHPAK